MEEALFLPPTDSKTTADVCVCGNGIWASLSVLFNSAAVHWAAAVRHRRRAHRFPTRLEATYTPAGQQLPRRRAIIHDLNTFGLALSSNDTLELGANLDVTIMLDDIQATVSGTVARVHTAPDATTAVGLAFDPLPASTSDAIARWCFSHPFGPDIDISPTGLTDAVAEAA